MSPTRWAGVGRPDGRRQTPEKMLDAQVMGVLRQLGFTVSRFQQARRSRITEGVPDLLALHTGWRLACWIELKAPGRTRSRAQDVWQATAAAAGQHVLTVWSVADLVAGLQALGAPIQREPPRGRNGGRDG